MKKKLEELLSEHPFLTDFPRRYLELMAGCAKNVRFEAGRFLVREGEPADDFFLLRRGRVAIEIHAPHRGPVCIQTLEAGEVLGWSWIVPPYRWHFDGRAAEDVTALSLDGACLRGKCDKDHELGYQLTKRVLASVARRLEATRLQLLDIYGVHS